jgi:hypothetical protein
MDLSFINVPTSQDELLGLLKVAYQAGQNSVGAKIAHKSILVMDSYQVVPTAKTQPKSTFKQWLTRLAHQWEDLKHS